MAVLKIAVDAMGGDYGLDVTIPATIKALQQNHDLNILLVGDLDKINSYLSKDLPSELLARIHLFAASEVVVMDESPAAALRHKRDSSMRIALELVKSGDADACVSAGNTGALMAIARFVLKTLPGVDRPAICSPLPTKIGQVHMLDLGANLECQAKQLCQFAIMGSILVSALQAGQSCCLPRVGLLNVGSEASKGTDVIKETSQLLAQIKDINYVGFVEGDDIFKGNVDLIVCDGFTGNVALKTSEGLADMILHAIKVEFARTWLTKLIGMLAVPIFKRLKLRFDRNNYNGGNLLGLQGVVVKSHGSAGIDAFVMAINSAILASQRQVPQNISSKVANMLNELECI